MKQSMRHNTVIEVCFIKSIKSRGLVSKLVRAIGSSRPAHDAECFVKLTSFEVEDRCKPVRVFAVDTQVDLEHPGSVRNDDAPVLVFVIGPKVGTALRARLGRLM